MISLEILECDLTLFINILFFIISLKVIVSSIKAETKLNKKFHRFLDISYSFIEFSNNTTDIGKQFKYRKKQY